MLLLNLITHKDVMKCDIAIRIFFLPTYGYKMTKLFPEIKVLQSGNFRHLKIKTCVSYQLDKQL